MIILCSGSKASIHEWQHLMIVDYYNINETKKPENNLSFY